MPKSKAKDNLYTVWRSRRSNTGRNKKRTSTTVNVVVGFMHTKALWQFTIQCLTCAIIPVRQPMMIRTLQHGYYRNCKIYYRNFGSTFEFLAVINGEVYTVHYTVHKPWFQKLLFFDYTAKQLKNTVNFLAKQAERTVDLALDAK